LAATGVGRNQYTVNMELEELLLVGPNCGGRGRRDNRGLQVLGRLNGLGSTSHEELVIDILGRERMEGEARIAA
jgi:hypothetical protein